jgi:hypothetical protein
VAHPVQVGARGGAGADVTQGVGAVEHLAPGGKVDPGQRIGDRFREAHRHSAECVDDAAEPADGIPAIDLRGTTRPLGAGIDIGAIEIR